ncbi:MAG: M55 family metallopeptidase [Anaerolineae bacterium]|nr:M55 family metallopeptidase [Anaerolineae bacterium]
MKVFIGTDVEGCAGVVSFQLQSYADARYYEQTRRIATAEVNAAVQALVAQGISDILVSDGHGPGGIAWEDLHPAAKLLHGRPPAPRSVRDAVIRGYDVCLMIGQHALAGTVDGNLNHTQSSQTVDYYRLNGRPIGEIAQFALYQGALGLPLIFLSGDEAACREAQELIPGITTAAVKKGLSRQSAISLSQAEAHRRIREGVATAIQKQRQTPLPPFTLPGPYELEVRFFHTDTADAYAQRPGVERVDSQTIRVRSDDIMEVIYL